MAPQNTMLRAAAADQTEQVITTSENRKPLSLKLEHSLQAPNTLHPQPLPKAH